MSNCGKKRCRRMLQLVNEVNNSTDDTSLPKYRRVYQKSLVRDDNSTSTENRVKILENIQIFPAPGTSKESICFNETPRMCKPFTEISNKKSNIYDSPSTGRTLHVLKNAEFPSTPVSTRHFTKSSKNSTPSSANIYKDVCSISRCSSVSDLSCAKFLTCPLSDEQVTELFTEKDNTVFEIHGVKSLAPIDTVVKDNKRTESHLSEDDYNNNIPTYRSPENSDLKERVFNSIIEEQDLKANGDYVHGEKICNSIVGEPDTTSNQICSKSDSEADEDYAPSESTDSESTLSDYTPTCTEIDSDSDNEDSQAINENVDLTTGDDEWQEIEESRPHLPEYTGECTIDISESVKDPYDFYKLFVCDEIIEKMVTETNNYAQDYIRKKMDMKPKSRLRNWTPTDREEMNRFLGVLMAMGLTKVPVINDYWSKKPLYRNSYISSIIKRDRFLMLLKFWHFSDQNNTEKLSKVKDVYLMLLERFQKVLKPGKFLIIDESMIPWRGRLSFRQYIKNKSHKYGVKLYKLCTPEGYTFNLIIYAGKSDSGREMDHGRKTVMRLTKNLVNEGRVVITDNFYNSVGLAEELLKNKTFICGTLRSNRKGLPKKIISTKLKKGEIIGQMNRNGVRVVKWFDKRPVYMISTCRDHDTTLKNIGKKTRGSGEEIKKPECVLTYNNNKKGIDYSDQMASYYTPLKRGLKWFRKVMMELLFGTALVNSWLAYNWKKEKRISKKEFYEAVIAALTNKPMGITATGSSRVVNLKKKHTFEKKGQNKRRCVGCYANKRKTMNSRDAAKKVKKILSYCKECEKSMCLECFYNAHL